MMEDGWSEVDYHYVTTMDACVLKQAKSTHGINYGGSPPLMTIWLPILALLNHMQSMM